MVFDSQSWRLIEVENNELMARCSLPDRQLIAGVEHPVEWRVTNKKSAPVQVFLSAGGDPGIEAQKQEVLIVKKSTSVVGTLVIDPEIPEKERDPKVALLNTNLVIGGEALELSAGIRVRQAVDIWLDTARSVIAPGAGQPIALSLRSRLDERVTVHLDIAPRYNTSIAMRRHRVTLDPHGGAELMLEIEAHESGPLGLEVAAHALVGRQKIPVKKRRLDLLAVAPSKRRRLQTSSPSSRGSITSRMTSWCAPESARSRPRWPSATRSVS